MRADEYSVYDQARLEAIPSDAALQRLGYYSEDLQPFLEEYKKKKVPFQAVYDPAARTDHITDENIAKREIVISSEPSKPRLNLSERLQKVRVEDMEVDVQNPSKIIEDPRVASKKPAKTHATSSQENNYASKLRSCRNDQ